MPVDKNIHLFQPRYSLAVMATVQEIADYLDRDKAMIREVLYGLPNGTALRSCDLPGLVDGAGNELPDPAATRELAHAVTYLPVNRWGALARMDGFGG